VVISHEAATIRIGDGRVQKLDGRAREGAGLGLLEAVQHAGIDVLRQTLAALAQQDEVGNVLVDPSLESASCGQRISTALSR
jgi:hypothetical protein